MCIILSQLLFFSFSNHTNQDFQLYYNFPNLRKRERDRKRERERERERERDYMHPLPCFVPGSRNLQISTLNKNNN